VADDSVGQLVQSATGGTVPSIDTREIITQVLVNDGQTVVLGGILDTTKSKTANKVPWLGDIPVLGNLFKSTTNVNNMTELLIFITPKILREGSTSTDISTRCSAEKTAFGGFSIVGAEIFAEFSCLGA